MKSSPLAVLLLSLALALAPNLSEAKRLGGGKSTGMQRNTPAQSTPTSPAQPTQAAPATPTPPSPAAAPQTPKRSWMGPLAGLAAGLGIGALLSHFGLGGALGGAFGSLLLIGLLAIAGVFVVRMLMQRRSNQPQAAGAAFGGGLGSPAQVAWPPASNAAPATPAAALAAPLAVASGTPPSRAFVPAGFDSEGFARIAKTIFIRMQVANDAGDLDDLRRFTTTEMFATLRMDLHDRAEQPQTTDVVRVDAEVLDVADDGQRQIVSVRFHGQLREEVGAPPTAFDEVWHLVKPNDDSRNWAIAGIEQAQNA